MPSIRDDVVDGLLRTTHVGLDYVYLDGGYRISDHGPHGEGVAFSDAFGLSRAVAEALLRSPCPLRGQEVRFLRTHLGMGRGAFAKLVGCAPYQLSEWEDAEALDLPPAFDRAVRERVSERLDLTAPTVERQQLPGGVERKLVAHWNEAVRRWTAEVETRPTETARWAMQHASSGNFSAGY